MLKSSKITGRNTVYGSLVIHRKMCLELISIISHQFVRELCSVRKYIILMHFPFLLHCTMLNLIRRPWVDMKRHSFYQFVQFFFVVWNEEKIIGLKILIKTFIFVINYGLGPAFEGPPPPPPPPKPPPPLRYSLVYLDPALFTFSPKRVLKLQININNDVSVVCLEPISYLITYKNTRNVQKPTKNSSILFVIGGLSSIRPSRLK